MRQVYLDYNATTPIASSVFEAMQPFLTQHYGNPSSSHSLGAACFQAIEDARENVAHLLGAASDEIIFTGGGTESNNLAIKGTCLSPKGFGGHLIISSIEHPATSKPADFLREMGCGLSVVGTNEFGVIDPAEIERQIRDDTVLVSIMHANNEIGTIQPIHEVGKICRERGVRLHIDAAQSIGKIRTNVDELGVDMLSIAGHKLYAPKGIGALYVRSGTPLSPILHGAAHEQGLRPGTENVPYIVGLGVAARLATRSLDENSQRIARLRDELYAGLQSAIGTDLTFNGPLHQRLPNTLSVNFPGVRATDVLLRAPEILASTGAACHSGATKLSDTLASIGLSPETARGTMRLSLGWHTSKEDIEYTINTLVSAWESVVNSS